MHIDTDTKKGTVQKCFMAAPYRCFVYVCIVPFEITNLPLTAATWHTMEKQLKQPWLLTVDLTLTFVYISSWFFNIWNLGFSSLRPSVRSTCWMTWNVFFFHRLVVEIQCVCENRMRIAMASLEYCPSQLLSQWWSTVRLDRNVRRTRAQHLHAQWRGSRCQGGGMSHHPSKILNRSSK